MKKVFDIVVESIYWLAIFASPFFLSFAIAAIVYSSHKNLKLLSIVIIIIGFVSGVVLAEKIRRKYGCSNYMSKILS